MRRRSAIIILRTAARAALLTAVVPLAALAQRTPHAAGWTRVRVEPVHAIRFVPLPAQGRAPRRATAGKTAAQLIASAAGATAIGLGAYFMLRDVGTHRVKGDDGYTRAGNVGYWAGSVVGAAAGAQLAGDALVGGGAVWATTLGAAIGTVPLFALGVDEPWTPVYGLVYGWPLQAALATGGYHLSRATR
jgi:hypothetical protein